MVYMFSGLINCTSYIHQKGKSRAIKFADLGYLSPVGFSLVLHDKED
jgi:hypothetical protein